MVQKFPSKNQNPREGIETLRKHFWIDCRNDATSKNQNPREGIETQIFLDDGYYFVAVKLQKTKIPARGLKRAHNARRNVVVIRSSKNQNPREGIETFIVGGGDIFLS